MGRRYGSVGHVSLHDLLIMVEWLDSLSSGRFTESFGHASAGRNQIAGIILGSLFSVKTN